jgi:diacylglycerol kinase (ATP)
LRVHLFVAFVVLVAALLFRFTAIEFVGLVLCFAVVIAAELFNTTLEVLIDYAWPEHHPMIGRAKDVAAAAVLVAAGGAALVGALLFARHILHLS